MYGIWVGVEGWSGDGGEKWVWSIPWRGRIFHFHSASREGNSQKLFSLEYFVLFSFLVKYLLEYFYLLVLYLSQFLLEFNDVFSESSMKLKFTVIYSSSKYCKVHLFVRSDLSRRKALYYVNNSAFSRSCIYNVSFSSNENIFFYILLSLFQSCHKIS